MNDNIYSLVESVFDIYLKRAFSIYDFNSKIDLAYNLKGHSLIGQCRKISKNHYLIRLHQPLIEHYGEVYLHDVLPHELAHAVAIGLYKKHIKPHGKEWKAILEKLEGKKIPNSKRPSYKILASKRKSNRFSYTCGCVERTHLLSTIRHNRILKGTHLYACKICKLPLVSKIIYD